MIYPSAQSGKRSDHGENVLVEQILQFLWINGRRHRSEPWRE
jgi:hypothetical protein